MMAVASERVASGERLASSELQRLVTKFVRRRVPSGEVDDVVQTIFCDAIASATAPDDDQQLRKWLMGLSRNKVADFHRRRGRQPKSKPLDESAMSDTLLAEASSPISAREWVDWAEKHTADNPDDQRTLEWMAREGEGEKLAHIATDDNVSPTQVRQRVSRLRRRMKNLYRAELAAVAAVFTVVALVLWWRHEPEPLRTAHPWQTPPTSVPTTRPPLMRAQEVRRDALADCANAEWETCIRGLDEAARMDPAGDTAPTVRRARELARDAVAPMAPSAMPAPSVAPSVEQRIQQKAPPTRGPAPSSTPPAPSQPAPSQPAPSQPTPSQPAPQGKTKPKPQQKQPSKLSIPNQMANQMPQHIPPPPQTQTPPVNDNDQQRRDQTSDPEQGRLQQALPRTKN